MSNMKDEALRIAEEQEALENQMLTAGLTRETMDRISAYIRKAQEAKND